MGVPCPILHTATQQPSPAKDLNSSHPIETIQDIVNVEMMAGLSLSRHFVSRAREAGSAYGASSVDLAIPDLRPKSKVGNKHR